MIVSRPVLAYQTIEADNLDSLNERVDEAIKDRWQPVGQATTYTYEWQENNPTSRYHQVMFMQTMVKFSPKPNGSDEYTRWHKSVTESREKEGDHDVQ